MNKSNDMSLDDDLAAQLNSTEVLALLLRYAEVQHDFVSVPAWACQINLAMSTALRRAQYGSIPYARPTMHRIGCAGCGTGLQYLQPAFGAAPRDHLLWRCNSCSSLGNLGITSIHTKFYLAFGGLLNAD